MSLMNSQIVAYNSVPLIIIFRGPWKTFKKFLRALISLSSNKDSVKKSKQVVDLSYLMNGQVSTSKDRTTPSEITPVSFPFDIDEYSHEVCDTHEHSKEIIVFNTGSDNTEVYDKYSNEIVTFFELSESGELCKVSGEGEESLKEESNSDSQINEDETEDNEVRFILNRTLLLLLEILWG